ncbi:helix-turn-helix transcriptional regulator [Amycolatopsis sp. A133]|uniref:helix-turn-helix domain-containing protein n=1 Tax=Amycolatopsis sp. A133 TaxID=3064472 RepID=UPI0027F8C3C4|nr:helix-turn-helix transcriptional regulator [Amycolatopsis sp. A133]MDQ7806888.1 helix-turn-helix transcriptional regulator [Amycolatopsis sp. A133]
MKPTSSTPRARALAAGLRELREAHGMGLRKLARILGFAPQALSLWEKGLRLPTVADVALILGFFEVRGEKQKHLLELARTARERDWVTPGSPEITPELSGLLECERSATKITAWAFTIIPGILQTADYARAILSNSDLAPTQADTHLVTRLNRQRILSRPEPVQYRAIISERALREPIADEGVMSDQMDHLLEVTKRPNVSLRVLTTDGSYHPGMLGSFFLYEYGDTLPIALLEHAYSSAFLYEEDHIRAYFRLAKVLSGRALSEDASRTLIAEAAR